MLFVWAYRMPVPRMVQTIRGYRTEDRVEVATSKVNRAIGAQLAAERLRGLAGDGQILEPLPIGRMFMVGYCRMLCQIFQKIGRELRKHTTVTKISAQWPVKMILYMIVNGE